MVALSRALKTTNIRDIDRDALLAAMEAELHRSLEGLSIPDMPDPYYLAYGLRRLQRMHIKGAHGSLVRDRASVQGRIGVDVRIGSPQFDNVADGGLEVEASERESADWLVAPDDFDPDAIKIAFWKLTEIKFDEAVEDYYDHRKESVTEFLRDEVDSFCPQQAIEHLEPLQFTEFPRAQWGARIRRVSARLRDYPDVYDPGITLDVDRVQRWFVDS